MPMNQVIQEKRKELGLTQEQVAEYLNVSAPAVSKWEKGTTSPDLALLPSLARLLKIDLNTLFCFQEDLTLQEINHFCKEITNIFQEEGFAAAFDTATKKLHEYPHNEELLHCLTFQLDGLFTMSRLSDEEIHVFEDTIVSWYQRLAESKDPKIRNSANYMMVSRYIRKGDYDNAQTILDSMPDRNDIISTMADKLMLQMIIYQQQGKAEKASEDLERALLTELNKVQMLLYKLVDAELAAGEHQTAAYIADKAAQMTGMFDLWEYTSFVAPLQIATADQDAEKCISILINMLESMLVPWDMGKSPLFRRIVNPASSAMPKQTVSAILKTLQTDSDYDFLRGCDGYHTLINRYEEYINTMTP